MSDRVPDAPREPKSVVVFINAQRVEVPQGALLRDALIAWNAGAASEVAAGATVVTDSRGLPIDAGVRVHGGAIFRTMPARGGEPS
ncbi:MAG: hypothetical protein ABJD07_02540 [Gemmatimonadaceae bacterium]